MTVGARVHHSAVVCSDVELSLQFYRDGLGMDVLMDEVFEGDWPTLFAARSTRLRSIFLGSAGDESAGIVELVVFDDAEPARDDRPPAYGFFLLSLYVDVSATLDRLAAFGVQPEGRTAMSTPGGEVLMATVRDPDGVLVELIGVPA
jgi:catechol 2,3-dioxygenase-like lactoylglutathione lyase family enzyme